MTPRQARALLELLADLYVVANQTEPETEPEPAPVPVPATNGQVPATVKVP